MRIVKGVVKDKITSDPIRADLSFTVCGDSNNVFTASATTDSITGEYTVVLFDSIFCIEVQPELPYPITYRDSAVVTPDTITGFDFHIDPATLLLVNRDVNAHYSQYYTHNLDSLEVTYVLWEVQNQGLPPFTVIDAFATRSIIWFSGDTEFNTITPEEQDSLITFLNEGGNLFLTGQTIAEELGSSILLNNYVHADFISNTNANILLGIAGDTISTGLNVYIVGGEPNNQISQELLAPLSGADSVFKYLSGGPGAVRYDGGLYKTVLFGFGFEAINNVGAFASRRTIMQKVLNWFGIETGVQEDVPGKAVVKPTLSVYPNPFASTITIYLSGLGQRAESRELQIFDVAGRRVKDFILYPSSFILSTTVSWCGKDNNGKKLANGIYFVTYKDKRVRITKKIVLFK
jgi:hypothetical protein